MSIETPNGPEAVDRQTLVEALKTKGFENEATREMLIAWSEQKEKEAMAAGTRKAQIEFEFDRAALFEDAGLNDYAIGVLIDLVDVVLADEYPGGEIDVEEYRSRAESKIALLDQ